MGNGTSVQWKVPAARKEAVLLKVFVDEKKKKVIFAEAEEDFVEILFSYFTLPLGTIAGLVREHTDSKDRKVGSLISLYEGVVSLDVKHFRKKWYKDVLVNPTNSSAHVCQKLKVNLEETKAVHCADDAIFFKKKARFIITDDLNVIPLELDTSITLLNSLGVECIDLMGPRIIYFGVKEFSNLLKWSLLTNNPLTTLIFAGSEPCLPWFRDSTLSNSVLMTSNSNLTPRVRVRLLLQKSKKKVLCAQVENRFVELLFSFLTIPLGAYLRLTKDSSSPVDISNLYDSISSLGEGKYLKSEDLKMRLLCPQVAANYHCVTDLLPIYEVDTLPGRFLKEQTTFIVSDDLKITASPSIAAISKFNRPDVPIGDMEFVELSIGEQEALLLLKASLTSTSAFTDCLKAFTKRPKDHVVNITIPEEGERDSEEVNYTLEEKTYFSSSFVMFD